MRVVNVRGWFAAYDRAQRKPKEGRAALAWLGLLGTDDEDQRSPLADYDRDAGHVGPDTDRPDGSSLSKPADLSASLVLLVGAGMIATLAIAFG